VSSSGASSGTPGRGELWPISRTSLGIADLNGGTGCVEVPSALGGRLILDIGSSLDEGKSRVGRRRVDTCGMRSITAAV
jgi:hypothetical protein